MKRCVLCGALIALTGLAKAGVFIEFSGYMTGNYAGSGEVWRWMILDNYAWEWFEDCTFTATDSNAGFLAGKDLSKLTLKTGKDGLAAAVLTWFRKTSVTSDHRLYTDGQFEVAYDGDVVVSGTCDTEVDVDYPTSTTTGAINGRILALNNGAGLDGSDFAAAFNDEHNNNQWRATILTMSPVLYNNVYLTTIRLESQPVERRIGVAAPVVGTPVNLSDAQVGLSFRTISDAGGGHVSAVRKLAVPPGSLPGAVVPSSVTQYWSIGSTLVSYVADLALAYDTNLIRRAKNVCVYWREDSAGAWNAMAPASVADGWVTLTNVTHFSEWFVGALASDDPELPGDLPDSVSEADRQMYESWIATNKTAWGASDFSGIPANDFLAAWLIGAKPVGGFSDSVALRVVSFEAEAKQPAETNGVPVAWRPGGEARPDLARVKVGLSVGGSAWSGPVNGNVVIQTAASLGGSWLSQVGQTNGDARVSFQNGVADLAFSRPAEGRFYRPVLSRAGRTGEGGHVAPWNGAATSAWVTCTVDSVATNGLYASLAFQASGALGICYYDSTRKDLKYAAYRNGTLTVQQVDADGDVGQYCDLAFSPDGQPAISYYDATQGDLKYAAYTGEQWVIQRVATDGDVGRYTSLAFATDGCPAISYQGAQGYDNTLNYASYNGSAWGVQTIDANAYAGYYTSLAFTPAGRPVIGYWEYDNYYVKCASFNGAGWSVENTYTRYAQSVSLAVATNGKPAIAQFNFLDSKLTYVSKGAYGWNSGTDVESFGVGSGASQGDASLAFAPDGYPAISYYDAVHGDLKYAKFNGASWALTTVESGGNVGQYTSLAFSPSGRPTIAYFDKTNGKLKIAEYVPVVRVSQ